MIGNDVVDLHQAALESNWQRKGYLAKIYRRSEQEFIFQAGDPAVMTWLIWTMKEASYKIANRISGLRSYNPLSFLCTELETDALGATGTIDFDQTRYYIRSKISDQLIHSTAVLDPINFNNISLSYLSYSKAYAEEYNASLAKYQLTKSLAGLPKLTHIDTGKSHAVSVSHHGRFLVIAYSDSLLLAD